MDLEFKMLLIAEVVTAIVIGVLIVWIVIKAIEILKLETKEKDSEQYMAFFSLSRELNKSSMNVRNNSKTIETMNVMDEISGAELKEIKKQAMKCTPQYDYRGCVWDIDDIRVIQLKDGLY